MAEWRKHPNLGYVWGKYCARKKMIVGARGSWEMRWCVYEIGRTSWPPLAKCDTLKEAKAEAERIAKENDGD